jgi:glutaredoxin-like protein NrdH
VDITVYTRPACGACIATKATLKSIGVEFTVADLADHPEVLEAAKKRDLLSAPIVVAGDEMWSGFDRDKLLSLA